VVAYKLWGAVDGAVSRWVCLRAAPRVQLTTVGWPHIVLWYH